VRAVGGVAGVRETFEGCLCEMRADIREIKADIREIKVGMARMLVLIEERSAHDLVMLEGLVAVMVRQERMEQRLDCVEETVRSLASARR
jgi:hypothetical protein